MRHQKEKRSSFGRRGGARKALIRGLVYSLVEHERIKTTVTKAKSVRPLIERALTLGKSGTVHSLRHLAKRYPSPKTVTKIIKDLSPRFKERPGGYTRIIRLGFRQGDNAPLAYIEFVDFDPKKKPAVSKNMAEKKAKPAKAKTPEGKSTSAKEEKKSAPNQKQEASAKPESGSKKNKQKAKGADKKRKRRRKIQVGSRRKGR